MLEGHKLRRRIQGEPDGGVEYAMFAENIFETALIDPAARKIKLH